MAPIGKVHDITKKFEFEWKIEDFLELPTGDEIRYDSPLFSFAGEYWFLAIYTDGQLKYDTLGWVALYLHRKEPGPLISVTASLSLRTSHGKKAHELNFTYVFEEDEGYGARTLLSRSTLSEKKLELLPSDTLTAVCTIEYFLKTDGKSKTEECSRCKKCFVPSPEQKFPDKPITCPTCADAGVRKCCDHECEKDRVKTTEKLFDDLENIFSSEEHSDVTIKVNDEEFRLHRCILAGRNSYFNSMFNTEMKEKTTGIVSIDDCAPHVFRSFIYFVYTGKVKDLSLENVCDLYEVADKYQEDQLKEKCLRFMNNKLSVETFCDFIVMALKYDEKELLQNAADLFCRKIKEIIQSVKWQNFVRDYPIQANELHIKALDYYMPSK